VFWAVLYPLAWLALFLVAVSRHSVPLSAMALVAPGALYVQLYFRVRGGCRAAGRSVAVARAYGFFCILGKWPETWGMLLYIARRISGRRPRWIEYKDGPRGLGSRGTLSTRHGSTCVEESAPR
jgi:hypothetical protein